MRNRYKRIIENINFFEFYFHMFIIFSSLTLALDACSPSCEKSHVKNDKDEIEKLFKMFDYAYAYAYMHTHSKKKEIERKYFVSIYTCVALSL